MSDQPGEQMRTAIPLPPDPPQFTQAEEEDLVGVVKAARHTAEALRAAYEEGRLQGQREAVTTMHAATNDYPGLEASAEKVFRHEIRRAIDNLADEVDLLWKRNSLPWWQRLRRTFRPL